MSERHCRIVQAIIEDKDSGGDGVYDLFDQNGSPSRIGLLIAGSLQECDMCRGPDWAYIEDGDAELYLRLTIAVARHPIPDDYHEEDPVEATRGDNGAVPGESGHGCQDRPGSRGSLPCQSLLSAVRGRPGSLLVR